MSYHRCDVPEHADLEDEVRRLTSEVQEEHRWSSGWRDLALRTEAEVKRLRDGIAAFRQVAENEVGTYECSCVEGGSTMDVSDRDKLEAAEEALYALLDGAS